ncbi:MAG: D-hexose-6-phosphate mutarotase [Janthinobacterium lividum]
MTDSITLHNAASDRAIISLFGGQVLNWFTRNGGEQLYLSPHAPAPGKAIRGGVPVCFPQFANWGTLVKHGFARTALWSLEGSILSGQSVERAHARLRLRETAATLAVWPHPFELLLDVGLSTDALELTLTVVNTGNTTFQFTAALHSYFSTDDVRRVALTGLEQTTYLDATDGNIACEPDNKAIMVDAEFDRIYNAAPSQLQLLANDLPALRITQSGFGDCVVWNPGAEKAAALGDMPANDWTSMFCIEAAQIEHAVRLAPGEEWIGSQRITSLAAANNGADAAPTSVELR